MEIVNLNTPERAIASPCAGETAVDGIPTGFVALPGGIYEVTNSDDSEPVWLCSPVSVTTVFRCAEGRGLGAYCRSR